MRVNQRDVAVRAGVSAKTVSNVINDSPHVSADLRARVERAIKELGYRPNLAARSLRSGRSGVIALAVPDLDVPYFAELATHIIKAAEERSWVTLIDQTEGLRDRESTVAAGIRGRFIDGLIISPRALPPRTLHKQAGDLPHVLLVDPEYGGFAPHIAIDNVAAGRVATAHLAAIGRKRIAAIGDQAGPSGFLARSRRSGYEQALIEAGHHVDPDLIVMTGYYQRADGAEAMQQLLALPEPPDAVFCFTDLLALGAMRTLLSQGIRVPDDVALIGIDGISEGLFSTPTLSTVGPDKKQLAAATVEALDLEVTAPLRRGRRPDIIVPHELVVRESTTCA